MLSQPQRQTEQRELVQHMLNAMKQQELRVAQQTEEQQQLVAQANTEIQVDSTLGPKLPAVRRHQLEFADTTECRNTIQAELKAAAASLQQAKEELQHFRTVLERAKLDYNKGTVRRDRAAALLPVLVARKSKRRCELEAEAAQVLQRIARWNAMEIEMAAQRQQAAQALADSERLRKETLEQLNLKGVEATFAERCLHEIWGEQEKQQAGIERVRQQCEAYAIQIQEAGQGLSELLQRQRVLANEIDIFRKDVESKDATIQCHQALQQRAVLRSQHSRLLQKIAACNVEVEESMMTSERLNSCLSELEEAMRRQKDAYEKAVESRNVTGVQLIDRNDELCLMWERSNAMEYAERRSLLATQEAESEVMQLRARAKELKQQLQIQQKRCRAVPELAEEVASLKDELAKEKSSTKRLRLELENPHGSRPWREVGRAEPDMEELLAKEKELQQRLNAQKVKLLDLQPRIEELDEANKDLYSKTESGREVAFELIETLGTLQQRLGEISKKERCLRAETIMYKTMLPQLTRMQEELTEQLSTARVNLLHRQPPSAAVEAELQQQAERRRKKRQILREAAEMKKAERERAVPRSSAPPRPSMYLPPEELEAESLPQPYGALAPFLPYPPAPSLRYFIPKQST
ncbi:hypothetical protein cyc_06864 [Cyclospora cayetanensis]|uniref:Coiled-coil domain-containing protein 146 n=1 Tax=Cyclospora cayetanensis TaxID=88456 RepID=A0A1D3D888_9EIME|nr:hypothetical protein cyc_06864 [Cyclospora cayetanensis]